MRPNEEINRQRNERQTTSEHYAKGAEWYEERLAEVIAEAETDRENGELTPVEEVLFKRQQEIIDNQRAIMVELGIS